MRRASISSIARGTTVPVTAGTTVRIVLLRDVTMPTRAVLTCGTTDVVTSPAMEPAGEL